MRGTSLDGMRDGFKGDDQYYMRRMKEILEAFPYKGPPFYPVQLCTHIYIGNQRNADDVEGLKRLGITHVLNCAGTRRFDLSKSPYPKSSGIVGYLMIPAEDHDHYDIMKNFPDAISFLDQCKSKGGKAFIHCNLGVNRSGAICAAYLMVYDQRPLLEVTSHLKDKRQFVLCNKNFRKQLIRFARCKGLLDNVKDSEQEQTQHHNHYNHSTDRTETAENMNGTGSRNGYYSSTQSLDRKKILRVSQSDISNNHDYDNHSLPRQSGNSYRSSPVYRNGVTRCESRESNSQLESVPERKPISDFLPTRSKYGQDYLMNGSSTSLPCSAPSTPKSVTFRRPTVSDILEDRQRVRSASASPTTKLKFLSKIGSKLTRQSSLTNVSQSSASEDDRNGNSKRSSLKDSSPVVDDSLSTTRPLRVYKRASSDTEVYCKPSFRQTYRRAETIASSNPGMERPHRQNRDDHLLPQEYIYHHTREFRNMSLNNRGKESTGSSSLNLLARLKPVSKSKR